jgi:hypothetical protein
MDHPIHSLLELIFKPQGQWLHPSITIGAVETIIIRSTIAKISSLFSYDSISYIISNSSFPPGNFHIPHTFANNLSIFQLYLPLHHLITTSLTRSLHNGPTTPPTPPSIKTKKIPFLTSAGRNLPSTRIQKHPNPPAIPHNNQLLNKKLSISQGVLKSAYHPTRTIISNGKGIAFDINSLRQPPTPIPKFPKYTIKIEKDIELDRNDEIEEETKTGVEFEGSEKDTRHKKSKVLPFTSKQSCQIE